MSEGVTVRPMGEADLRRYVPVRLEDGAYHDEYLTSLKV